MRLTAPHFCAGAVWHKSDGKWRCVDAAPILKWMIGKGPEIKDYLQRKGWKAEWVPVYGGAATDEKG